MLRQVREQEKETKDALSQADRELGMSCLGHPLDPLREKYAGLDKVLAYLNSVQEDILNTLDDFKPQTHAAADSRHQDAASGTEL